MDIINGTRVAVIGYKGESWADNAITYSDFTEEGLDADYTFKVYKGSVEVLSLSGGNGVTVDSGARTVDVVFPAGSLSAGKYIYELQSVSVTVDKKLKITGELELI